MEHPVIPSHHVMAMPKDEMLLLCYIPNETLVLHYTSVLKSCKTMDEALSKFFAPLLMKKIISEKTAVKLKFLQLLQPFVEQIPHHSASTLYRHVSDLIANIKHLKK